MKYALITCCLFIFLVLYSQFTNQAHQGDIPCKTGLRTGGAAQRVCLMDMVVLKKNIPCSSPRNYKCLFAQVKQEYTNSKWRYYLNDVEAVAKMLDSDPMTFERVDHVETAPKCKENRKRLQEVDETLGKHNLFITDVNKVVNLVLNVEGKVVLIDFNVFPELSRYLVDKFDKHSKPLAPYKNIYGMNPLGDWIC